MAMQLTRLHRWFPVWAVLGAALAYWLPGTFVGAKSAIVPLLALVMFGMGITLRGSDFLVVLRRPRIVLLGVALQFLLMPLIGWVLAGVAGLSAGLVAGVVLLGSCPGGTASNVMCYLARGDVALSITLTAVSTILAVIATPLLTWLYLGERVAVPVLDLLASTSRIVLLPVLLGVIVNHLLGRWLGQIRHLFPLLSMFVIVFIIAIIVAANRAQLGGIAAGVLGVVVVHNLLGFTLGYLVPRALRCRESECRTIAIEVGMQNSGLAVALAMQHFSALAALPGALFSIWHNVAGSWLAAYWRARSRPDG